MDGRSRERLHDGGERLEGFGFFWEVVQDFWSSWRFNCKEHPNNTPGPITRHVSIIHRIHCPQEELDEEEAELEVCESPWPFYRGIHGWWSLKSQNFFGGMYPLDPFFLDLSWWGNSPVEVKVVYPSMFYKVLAPSQVKPSTHGLTKKGSTIWLKWVTWVHMYHMSTVPERGYLYLLVVVSNIVFFHHQNWGNDLIWLVCFRRVTQPPPRRLSVDIQRSPHKTLPDVLHFGSGMDDHIPCGLKKNTLWGCMNGPQKHT